jgi:metal-responsive CopG/Arc/MetJ family transcriptional regulator
MSQQTKETRLLQIDLPVDLVREIDRLASEETLTRTAWVRRLLHGVVKNQSAGQDRLTRRP